MQSWAESYQVQEQPSMEKLEFVFFKTEQTTFNVHIIVWCGMVLDK